MSLTSTDRFKAAFGVFASGKLPEWKASARDALDALQRGVDALVAANYPGTDVFQDTKDLQELQFDTARTNEVPHPETACQMFRGVAQVAGSALRNLNAQMIATPPNAVQLRAIQQIPGGPAAIDRLIAQIGTKASTQPQRDLVANAIKVRFDIDTLTGDLSTKAMPRLYELLRRLPDAHTTGNESLSEIQRVKAGDKPSGSFGNGVIRIVGTESGVRAAKKDYFDRSNGESNAKELSFFDAIVTHEVGHAVDDAQNITGGMAGAADNGDWHSENFDSIVDAALVGTNFNAAFPGLAASDFGQKLLKDALRDGQLPPIPDGFGVALNTLRGSLGDYSSIQNDPGLSGAYNYITMRRQNAPLYTEPSNQWPGYFDNVAIPNKDVFKSFLMEVIGKICSGAMSPVNAFHQVFDPLFAASDQYNLTDVRNHAAVAWLVQIGSSEEGNWRESGGALQRRARGGRVYQQSYSGVYWSYDMAARAHMVRDYQFRAPGEWFAELYTAYFLNVIGTGHRFYPWMSALFGPPPQAMS